MRLWSLPWSRLPATPSVAVGRRTLVGRRPHAATEEVGRHPATQSDRAQTRESAYVDAGYFFVDTFVLLSSTFWER